MSAQEEYNREVVAKARDVVKEAGLEKLPLTQALAQIAHGFRDRGAGAVQDFIDGK